jgi:cation diffusion facilitator family transporter
MASPTSKKVIYAALAGNSAIAVTKFLAALATGSAAMLSEAIHSVVDTGNQLLLLFGLRSAAKQPSARHPFGYGLELYFYTFVVAVLIFGVGAVISILHGIEKLEHPLSIEDPWINYVVLGMSIVFESAVWLIAFKAFKKERAGRKWISAIRASKDPTVFTVLLEDTAALLGLVVALLGVWLSEALDIPALDGIASIGIGVILAVTAIFLAARSKSLLTGEAASFDTRLGINRIARAAKGVTGLNQALTMHFGPNDVFVALSLDFDDTLPAAEVERTVTAIEREIKAAHPDVTRVFIEAQSFDADRRAGMAEVQRRTEKSADS